MKYFVSSLFLLCILVPGVNVSAHELLPQEVIEFLKEHPNATPQEINEFADTQDPVIAEKIKVRSADILQVLTNNTDAGFFHNAKDFIRLGSTHILSGPDHILFVLTLLLVFISVGEIFRLITTFTIAHSLTLILAGTGTLLLSASVVEPIIALSIAVMAILTTFYGHLRFMGNLWAKTGLVFFFGLFHGLGFAGLLKEISVPNDAFLSSLVSFNIGIEIGQLIIIALALPCILYFRKRTWYPIFIKCLAIGITGIATFWFLERIV